MSAPHAALATESLDSSLGAASTALAATSWLQLLRLASPALPVGGFSYSEGLEAAVTSGWVQNEQQAQEWLLDQLLLGLAPSELTIVIAALPAWRALDLATLQNLNNWILQTRETAEMRLQTEQMGRSMAVWLKQRHLSSDQLHCLTQLATPTYPVAWSLAAALAPDIPPPMAALTYAFGWAENMVQAAIKAIPLGQSAGQRMLDQLTPALTQAVTWASQLSASQRQAFTPGLAILSAQHEVQYSRLFRS